jgi:Protein of unknown function (DUF3572)
MHHPKKGRLSTSPRSDLAMAIAALTFLAADPERLTRFLSVTGLGPNNLRGAAADPGFCGGVLEYLLADEPLLLAFAGDAGFEPGDVARAHQGLSGPPPDGS